jgi:cytidylate kinase
MKESVGSEKGKSFTEFHFDTKGKNSAEAAIRPAVTISREAGARGHTVAAILADYLQKNVPSRDVWTVFDRNIVEEALQEHKLPERIAAYMKEGHKAMLIDSLEEWLGVHPGTWTLVQQINATILRLAEMGNVILVGRSAVIVTSELANAFHVRLVGSFEKRLEWLQQVHGLDEKEALKFLKKEDEGRRRYLKDNFGRDIDDPLLYHITINTDLVNHDEAARLIGEEVIRRFKLDNRPKAAGSENRSKQQ